MNLLLLQCLYTCSSRSTIFFKKALVPLPTSSLGEILVLFFWFITIFFSFFFLLVDWLEIPSEMGFHPLGPDHPGILDSFYFAWDF